MTVRGVILREEGRSEGCAECYIHYANCKTDCLLAAITNRMNDIVRAKAG